MFGKEPEKESTPAYESLLSRGSSDFTSDTTLDTQDTRLQYRPSQPQWRRIFPTFLQVAIALALTSVAFVWAWNSLRLGPTDQQCATQLSVWSPALEAVEYESFNFNNSFGSSSIYRGPPTPAVEEAWTILTRQHGFEYPADQIHNLNRSEADHLKHVRPEIGTGYVALLEVFHQLHCLNMIRQYTWFLEPEGDYEKPPFNPTDLVGNRMHIDHCIETLRIAIMCHGDVSPVLVMQDPESPIGAKADFNSYHKCRNFDNIRGWLDENWIEY